MFKIEWWRALKEQTQLIAQTPVAAYGAAMTAIAVVLIGTNLYTGKKYIDCQEYINNRERQYGDEKTNILLMAGKVIRQEQTKTSAALDSAFLYKFLYNTLKPQGKN